jgi:D-alanyl-D-alanine carboxypeptidase (penicillin-binding protein 5/6)
MLRSRRAARLLPFLVIPWLLLGAAPAAAEDPADLRSAAVLTAPGAPPVPEIAAESWVVADLDTGEVLAARDAHARLAPASTLKVLTALTLMPRIEPGRVLVPTPADVAVEGSKVGLVAGLGYPAAEVFGSLLMVSGNDSANVLASAVGGQAAAAELMNEQARKLGALDTHAVNPHGLDAEGQVSSAHDLAVIGRAAMAVPEFATHVATRRSSIGGPVGSPRIEINNKNKLLKDYPGALGIKNGFTSSARASFVGAAERDGRRLIVTVMKADPKVFDEAQKLLDWGFSARDARPIATLGRGDEHGAGAVGTVVGGLDDLATTGPALAEGTGLPVTLAGFGLAAAALVAVSPRGATRPRPRPRRRPQASRTRSTPVRAR